MSPSEPAAPSARVGTRVGPFVAFFAVALLAAAGAVFEISYWVGLPALAPQVLGTTIGIVGALVAFFVWGWWAPGND
ncbi:MAG TPA: hypothetical protein VMG99_04785 [Thermoplasmata archaeon]|jgi:hypothetical protein|nr:hypothetical protein [Thermoplasmata archaeon]